MKSIMIALMRIAIDEEIIVENPMNGIYIKSKFRAVRKKGDGSKLYLNDEFDALDTHLENESTIEALCIRLMFCRVTIDVTPTTIQKRLSPIEC